MSVFFDASTAKHRLDVEFTEAVSQAMPAASVPQVTTDDGVERIEGTSGDANENPGSAGRTLGKSSGAVKSTWLPIKTIPSRWSETAG